MKCSVENCPGEYQDKYIVHTIKYRGKVIVIDHVPAEVCAICGDVLLKPQTVRKIEAMLHKLPEPTTTIPLYEYA